MSKLDDLLETIRVRGNARGVSVLVSNDADLLLEIVSLTSYLSEDADVRVRLYHLANSIDAVPTCAVCDDPCSFRDFPTGYNSTCGKKKCRTEHTAKVSLESSVSNNGGVHYFATDEFKNKAKSTHMSNLGVDNPFKSESVKHKIRSTNILKYGTISPMQNKVVSDAAHAKLTKNNLAKINAGLVGHTVLSSTNNEYTVLCDTCKNESVVKNSLFNLRLRESVSPCLHCVPFNYFTSSGESELTNFITSVYDGLVITKDRKVLSGTELDVFLPDLNIAFEYNGLYWHNELYKSNSYHADKTKKCEDAGIRLIHIWQDSWMYKRAVIESQIRSMLGKSIRVFARKCEIRYISEYDSKEFFDANHLQGNVRAAYRLALFYDDQMVCVMTFGKGRSGIGIGGSNVKFEMMRFANSIGHNVVGGASRLMKAFVKDHCKSSDVILSYADASWSSGNLYEKLGFSYKGLTVPGYYYVVAGERKHRYAFRKSELVSQGFDPDKTEHQIMLGRKLYRIYNCGNHRYMYIC